MQLPDSLRRLPWRDLKYAAWLPPYLLGFVLLEQRPMEEYWVTQLPLDDLIPFCEWFAIPYCLWYPLLVGLGLYLLFRDGPAFRRYMAFLALTFFVSELIWLLVPNGQDLRPVEMLRDNPLTRLMVGLYTIDTNTNVFPSVHVVGAAGAAIAAWDCAAIRKNRPVIWGITILSAFICLSVVFVKQHAVLDLVSGLVLCIPAGLWIYPKRT